MTILHDADRAYAARDLKNALALYRRALRTDVLDRRRVERLAECSGALGMIVESEVWARALAALPALKTALGRTLLPAASFSLKDGYLSLDGRRLARVWLVGLEGYVVEKAGPVPLPDGLVASVMAGHRVDVVHDDTAEKPPFGIAFLDSNKLFWARTADDFYADPKADAETLVSSARFFPSDDTRALLIRYVERSCKPGEPADRVACSWLRELAAADVQRGNHRLALRGLQVLHRADPKDSEALELIAQCFEAAGLGERARVLASQASQIRSGAPSVASGPSGTSLNANARMASAMSRSSSP